MSMHANWSNGATGLEVRNNIRNSLDEFENTVNAVINSNKILENKINQFNGSLYSNALKGELTSGTYENDTNIIYNYQICSQVSPLPHNMSLTVYPLEQADTTNWTIQLQDLSSFTTVFETNFPENNVVSIPSDLIKSTSSLYILLIDKTNIFHSVLGWKLTYNMDINTLISDDDNGTTIIGGYYYGTWTCDENEMEYQSGEQVIDLGITPKTVIVAKKGYIFSDEQSETWGGFVTKDQTMANDFAMPVLSIVDNGFKVLSARNFNMSNTANPGDWGSNWGRLNENFVAYSYIALV